MAYAWRRSWWQAIIAIAGLLLCLVGCTACYRLRIKHRAVMEIPMEGKRRSIIIPRSRDYVTTGKQYGTEVELPAPTESPSRGPVRQPPRAPPDEEAAASVEPAAELPEERPRV